MSLELSPTKFEIRDDATGDLVLDHATKLIPMVQEVTLTNVDLAFPDVSKGVTGFNNSGVKDGDTKAWRAQCWGLRINEGIQEGAINLAAITPGLAPNLMLGNIRAFRLVNPRENVFGPVTKSMSENKWLPAAGGRLEYSAWCRRIFWFSIGGGFLRLNWKQSTAFYSPNDLDPNWAWSHPERYLRLSAPPAYQLGSSFRELPLSTIFPPAALADPSVDAGPGGALSFASTWRFSNINIWLMQL